MGRRRHVKRRRKGRRGEVHRRHLYIPGLRIPTVTTVTAVAPATMSTTPKLEVALRYAASASPILLRLHTRSFIERGADISFCSAFPDESEVVRKLRMHGWSQKRRAAAGAGQGGESEAGERLLDAGLQAPRVGGGHGGEELVVWDALSGRAVGGAAAHATLHWDTWTCPLGWPAHAAWVRCCFVVFPH